MAKKAAEKKVQTLPSDQEIFQAVFDRIAEKGFGKTRISDLAETLSVPLADFYNLYPSVDSILSRFLDHIDSEMIKNGSFDSGTKRDVYFDMLMNRFDALQSYGPGVKTWLKEIIKNPVQLLMLLTRWEKTLSLMLDIAKDSPVFPVKKIGLGLVYISALRSWMNDDDSLDKTMVAIDQALSKADDFSARFLTKKKPEIKK